MTRFLAGIASQVVRTTSLENFTKPVDEFFHCHSVHDDIVDRDLNSVDSEQNLFHHLLESFACITKTEGSTLKPKNNHEACVTTIVTTKHHAMVKTAVLFYS